MRVTEHKVPEDNIIARFRAEDKDSGAFGQVMIMMILTDVALLPDSPDRSDLAGGASR